MSPTTWARPDVFRARAAAAEVPAQQAVREWATELRAFTSTVMDELPAERRAAADAVRAVGETPVMFEEFGGRDAHPKTLSQSALTP